MYWTQQRWGWVWLIMKQCLQVHHLIPKRGSGNFGHVVRSQAYVRVCQTKLKACFAENACRSPTLLLEVSTFRSAVFNERALSLTNSSGSKGALCRPSKTTERFIEGKRSDLGGWSALQPLLQEGKHWPDCASLWVFCEKAHQLANKLHFKA